MKLKQRIYNHWLDYLLVFVAWCLLLAMALCFVAPVQAQVCGAAVDTDDLIYTDAELTSYNETAHGVDINMTWNVQHCELDQHAGHGLMIDHSAVTDCKVPDRARFTIVCHSAEDRKAIIELLKRLNEQGLDKQGNDTGGREGRADDHAHSHHAGHDH